MLVKISLSACPINKSATTPEVNEMQGTKTCLEKSQSQPLLQSHQHLSLPSARLILPLSFSRYRLFPATFSFRRLSIRPLRPALQRPASPPLEIPLMLLFCPFHYRPDRRRVHLFDQSV